MGDGPAGGVARSYFEAIGRHDLDAAMACWHVGGIDHLAPVGELCVPDALRAYFDELFAAMPDLTYEVLDLFEQDDRVAVHWRISGRFTGRSYQGIRANGASIVAAGADIVRVEDGLIRRLDSYWDDSSLARQIGVLPARGSRQERGLIGLFNVRTRLRARLGRGA